MDPRLMWAPATAVCLLSAREFPSQPSEEVPGKPLAPDVLTPARGGELLLPADVA